MSLIVWVITSVLQPLCLAVAAFINVSLFSALYLVLFLYGRAFQPRRFLPQGQLLAATSLSLLFTLAHLTFYIFNHNIQLSQHALDIWHVIGLRDVERLSGGETARNILPDVVVFCVSIISYISARFSNKATTLALDTYGLNSKGPKLPAVWPLWPTALFTAACWFLSAVAYPCVLNVPYILSLTFALLAWSFHLRPKVLQGPLLTTLGAMYTGFHIIVVYTLQFDFIWQALSDPSRLGFVGVYQFGTLSRENWAYVLSICAVLALQVGSTAWMHGRRRHELKLQHKSRRRSTLPSSGPRSAPASNLSSISTASNITQHGDIITGLSLTETTRTRDQRGMRQRKTNAKVDEGGSISDVQAPLLTPSKKGTDRAGGIPPTPGKKKKHIDLSTVVVNWLDAQLAYAGPKLLPAVYIFVGVQFRSVISFVHLFLGFFTIIVGDRPFVVRKTLRPVIVVTVIWIWVIFGANTPGTKSLSPDAVDVGLLHLRESFLELGVLTGSVVLMACLARAPTSSYSSDEDPVAQTSFRWRLYRVVAQHAFKISLILLFFFAAASVDVFHAGYMALFILYSISPELAARTWIILVLYTQLAITTLMFLAFQFVGELSPTLIELFGIRRNLRPIWPSVYQHLLVLAMVTIQLHVYRSLVGRESEGLSSILPKKIGKPVTKLFNHLYAFISPAVMYLAYIALVIVALAQPGALYIAYVLLLMACATIHQVLIFNTRRSLRVPFYIMACVTGLILIARYTCQFKSVNDRLVAATSHEVVFELGLNLRASGDLFLSLIGSASVFFLSIWQLRLQSTASDEIIVVHEGYSLLADEAQGKPKKKSKGKKLKPPKYLIPVIMFWKRVAVLHSSKLTAIAMFVAAALHPTAIGLGYLLIMVLCMVSLRVELLIWPLISVYAQFSALVVYAWQFEGIMQTSEGATPKWIGLAAYISPISRRFLPHAGVMAALIIQRIAQRWRAQMCASASLPLWEVPCLLFNVDPELGTIQVEPRESWTVVRQRVLFFLSTIYRRFGVAATAAALLLNAYFHLNAVSILYGLLAGVLLWFGNSQGVRKAWPVLVTWLALVIIAMYCRLLLPLPFAFFEYPWRNLTSRDQHFLLLDPGTTVSLIPDFVTLLMAAAQARNFGVERRRLRRQSRVEMRSPADSIIRHDTPSSKERSSSVGSATGAGSSTGRPHALSSSSRRGHTVSNVSAMFLIQPRGVFDELRVQFYRSSPKIILLLTFVFGTSASSANVLGVGYIVMTLFFFQYGEKLNEKRNEWWKWLQIYSFAVVMAKLIYQAPYVPGSSVPYSAQSILGLRKLDADSAVPTPYGVGADITILILASVQAYIFDHESFALVVEFIRQQEHHMRENVRLETQQVIEESVARSEMERIRLKLDRRSRLQQLRDILVQLRFVDVVAVGTLAKKFDNWLHTDKNDPADDSDTDMPHDLPDGQTDGEQELGGDGSEAQGISTSPGSTSEAVLVDLSSTGETGGSGKTTKGVDGVHRVPEGKKSIGDDDDDDDDEEDNDDDDDDDEKAPPSKFQLLLEKAKILILLAIAKVTAYLRSYTQDTHHVSDTDVTKNAMLKFFAEHTSSMCWLSFAINAWVHGDLLSLPYPLAAFLYGLLVAPYPGRRFWKTMLAYTEFLIVIKFIYQMPVFCTKDVIATSLDSANIFRSRTRYSLYPDCSPVESIEKNPYQIQYILGIEKYDKFFLGIAPEVFSLLMILVHLQVLRSLGLDINDSESVCAKPQDPAELDGGDVLLEPAPTTPSKEDHGTLFHSHDGDIPNDTTIDTTSDGVPMPAAELYADDGEYHVVDGEEDGDEEGIPDPRPAWPLRMWQECVAFWNNLTDKKGEKVGRDFYMIEFAAEFFCFVWTMISYNQTSGESAQSLGDALKQNQLSGSYVFFLLLQFAFILINRVLYVERLLKAKVIFHAVLVVGFHIVIFYLFPHYTNSALSVTPALVFLYMLRCTAFTISCLQIRYGYPSFTKGQFFYKRTSFAWSLVYLGYRAIPFAFELRTLLDWLTTETTLPFYDWLKFEDLYGDLYLVKCDVEYFKDQGRKPGDKQPLATKAFNGCGVLLLLVVILWAPLLMFSTWNPSNAPNPVISADVTIGVDGFQSQYTVSAQRSGLLPVSAHELLQLANEKDTLGAYLRGIDPGTVQRLTLPINSEEYWDITPPSKSKLISMLNDTATPVTVTTSYSFTREAPGDNRIISGTHRHSLGPEDQMRMHDVITGATYTPYRLPNAFPIIVQLPVTGELMVAGDEYSSVYLGMESLSGGPNGTWPIIGDRDSTWWYASASNTSVSAASGPVILIISNKRPEGLVSALGATTILGLYVTVVLAIGRFLRLYVTGISKRIIYENLPNPDPLLQYCEDVAASRAEKDLVLEEMLYRAIVDLYRSPRGLILLSRLHSKRVFAKDAKDAKDQHISATTTTTTDTGTNNALVPLQGDDDGA